MSQSNQTNSYTEFFYKAFRNILIISIPLVIISALVLSLPHSSATTSSTDDITLTLDVACTVSSEVTSPHSVSDMHVGQYKSDIGNTDISVFCNDNNGYSVYAVGNSNNIDGNTDLVSNISDSYNIHTGTNIAGNSAWAMKLTAGTGSASDTTPPTIINGFDNYSTIPNVYTQVAKRTSGTSTETDTKVSGSYFSTTYQIYANSIQPAGTYTGKVKYVMVHPNSNHNTIPDLDTAFAINGKMKVYEEGGSSYYAMQDMDSQICSSVGNTGASTATQLVDARDYKLYWVAKLADGHCWMTQNLDLDLDPNKPLTSNYTDLIDHSLSGAYANNYSYDVNTGITTWTPVASAKTKDFAGGNNTKVPGWTNSNYVPATYNKADSTETGHASLGNYYNWTAAIASNNSSALTESTYGDINNNPQNSICPKGWRLPTISNQFAGDASSTNEFARLNYIYNNNSTISGIGLTNSPLWFAKAGYIVDGIFSEYNTGGFYWSSSIKSDILTYGLVFKDNLVSPEYSADWSRYRAFTIRCLAR